MKIRVKVFLLMAGVLAVSFGVCGAFSVSQHMNTSVRQQAENEEEKMKMAQWAFSQTGTKEELEKMSELARMAYLKYQFEQCYQSGYALMREEACIKNLTGYEIINGKALTDDYQVQKAGAAYLLLSRMELEYPEGFWVMSVKDITDTWTEAKRQIFYYCLIFVCIFGLAVTVTALGLKRMLGVIEQLKEQAETISRGDFSKRTEVNTGDELSELSDCINQMSDKIREQIQDLQLLPGAIAHEMKTPVTNISGYADSLLHVRLNETMREQALQAIYRSAGRLDKLSGKLLQMISLYENDSIVMESVSMGVLLRQCIGQAETFIKGKKSRIQLNITAEPEPDGFWVKGDRLLLELLFENLVSNAVKALDEAGTIRLWCGRGSVVVEDDGCGIRSEDLPHVCKAFYMADKSRDRGKHGSGLGLALAERIVQVHGARLQIESKEGIGTRVTVWFPEEKIEVKGDLLI